MTVINTNMASLYAQQAMNSNARGLATVMQQLSTGKRINNAVDDVAGLAISTRLTSQINGLNQAVRNANDGISLIQTAEGSTEQVTNMLQRMRELAVQSSNDTNNTNDRGFLDGEFQQLKQEIDRVAQNTQWNGANILDGTGGNSANGTFAFQVGANANQIITIKLGDLQTAATPGAAVTSATTTTPHGTSIVAAFNGAGVATSHLTGLDVSAGVASASVGLVVQASFGGKAVQYKITAADVAATTATPPKTLSATVADALAGKLNLTFGSSVASDVSGVLTVTPPSGQAPFSSSNSSGVGFVTGELSAIANSDITTAAGAYSGLQAIDSALQTVNASRSNMGAVISRLQFASDNLANISTQAQASQSRILDTDYSQATTELAKRNIIQQASQAMLAQANQQPQTVLQLLK